jgi:ABC-type multidrug transport system fused ATPase/permease subunit
MKAFLKALRYCWPYRSLIILGWLCALAATVFYRGSITSAAPILNLLFQESAKNVRYYRRPMPTPAEPNRKVWTLEISPHWKVVEDPAVETFVVAGDTVRIKPGLPIIQLHEGLDVLASQAEVSHKFYAPAARWVTNLLPADRYDCLLWIMVAVVAMTILRGALRYANDYLVGYATNRAMLALRLRVYDHVLRTPLADFTRIGPSDTMSRFQQDCFLVQEGMKTLLGKVFSEPIRATACLVVAVAIGVSIDPWLPVIVLVAAPLIMYMVRQFAKLMRRSSRKALESWAVLMGILEESLFGIRVVKGYELEGHQRRKFFQTSRRLFKQILRGIRIDAITEPAVETIFTIAVAGGVILAGKIIIDRALGQAGFTQLMLFFAFLAGALDPARKLSNVSNRLQQAVAGSDRVFGLIAMDVEPRYGAKGLSLPRLRQSIEFRNVSFAYTAGKPVLSDINLTVRYGEVLAIIGRTGCGKTTLVSLIPRFFEPNAGVILLDGADIHNVTLRSLREQIAYVPQEVVLFDDTVAANIALGAIRADRHPPSREAVERAARAAHADAFIQKLPKGFDAVIGERGTTLSGGERQRLALARAILRDPAILILDEATSALDEETQALVQDTLRQFVKGRTTLLIAHRLSTLAIADRIALMDAGRIIDIGTHEELLQRSSLYQRLRDAGLELG